MLVRVQRASGEEIRSLRESVRGLVQGAGRDAPASGVGPAEEALWRRACELGLAGLQAPERCGGAGLGLTAAAAVLEELGRTLSGLPFLPALLATNALLLAATPEQQDRLLAAIAAGDVRPAVALDGTLEAAADGTLTGAAGHVLDGLAAELLLVPARDPAGTTRLHAVAGDAPGLAREPLPTLDRTRPQARLTLAATPAAPLGRSTAFPLERLRDIAAVALAAEQVGAAERVLERSLEHARTRRQFGRPIGSFQAIKHLCARVAIEVRYARVAASAAARAADGEDDAFGPLAALAGAQCSEALLFAARANIQLHGGIGFTWEHDAHLYYRRAIASAHLVRSPSAQRERLVGLLETGLPGVFAG